MTAMWCKLPILLSWDRFHINLPFLENGKELHWKSPSLSSQVYLFKIDHLLYFQEKCILSARFLDRSLLRFYFTSEVLVSCTTHYNIHIVFHVNCSIQWNKSRTQSWYWRLSVCRSVSNSCFPLLSTSENVKDVNLSSLKNLRRKIFCNYVFNFLEVYWRGLFLEVYKI